MLYIFYIYRSGFNVLNTGLHSIKAKVNLFSLRIWNVYNKRHAWNVLSRLFFPRFSVQRILNTLEKKSEKKVRFCRDSRVSSALLRGWRSLRLSFEVALNSNLEIRKVYWPLHKTGLHNEACFCRSPSRMQELRRQIVNK